VLVEGFWSMWRSRSVPSPWGPPPGGGPAPPTTDTLLLHFEDLKIPEHLGRFAIKHGMWGFVKKMAANVPSFVAARRQRVAPDAEDPAAYGSAPLAPAAAEADKADEAGPLRAPAARSGAARPPRCASAPQLLAAAGTSGAPSPAGAAAASEAEGAHGR